MTKSDIKKILSELGVRPNKKQGQHFLMNQSVLRQIVAAADVKPGDRVLEIGPGLGVLTNALCECGAEVVAIEQDRRLISSLIRGTPPLARGGANRRIVHGNAVTVHWHELIGDKPWKFISNLPYGITSLALRKALWSPRPPEIVVVLVQREVAERAIAKDGKTSLLSLMVALASSQARIVKRVSAGAFYPPPKVESAILQIIPMSWAEREQKWGIDPDKIMEVVKKGFAHPRKFVRSNLGLAPIAYRLLPHENARAEDLSPEQWAALSKTLEQGS